jgi:hypothetical protein
MVTQSCPANIHDVATKDDWLSVWGFLAGPDIEYGCDGGEFHLDYHQWPLGPFGGYDSATGRWHHFE